MEGIVSGWKASGQRQRRGECGSGREASLTEETEIILKVFTEKNYVKRHGRNWATNSLH